MSEGRSFGAGALLAALITGAAAGAALVFLTTKQRGRELRTRFREAGRAGLGEARRYRAEHAERPEAQEGA